ncbi:purine-nucleoside phosphorylase [Scatolibacter rhodanostii]|uniref:purine-nucleoside phosphorylase n=1 Tax=Scatolibacter rhodanostii TaxID=2014781 RepID=UPI000C070824|nr:purine-nucleoside phosphorylase [Scatolibacter rhodanostii]
MDLYFEKINLAADFLRQNGIGHVDTAVILGSGLGEFAESLQSPSIIPYQEIPGFPVSTVKGHAGRLVYGILNGKKVLAMQGRFHYYEGYPMNDVVFPIRVMAVLGIKQLLVTNAAGGVNESFSSAQLMLITDHINFMGTNPLIGQNLDTLGPRFPDMSHAYFKKGQELVKAAASDLHIPLQEGVYAAFTGPSYETPAEIRMARIWGADAVGMSTVPEVIVANQAGIAVIGISCITNMAAGLQKNLNHEEVVQASASVKDDFKALLSAVITAL